MYLIVSKYLVPKGFRAITAYPFVMLRDDSYKDNSVLINHERIHIRQQIEMLILPFYVFYFFDFLIKLIIYRNRNRAYNNVGFEREAYDNERNPDYLKSRPFWRFLLYL
jgi:hypothetical protein